MVRAYLIAVIGVALLASGALPPEHLHHSTAARPPIVHSHLETGATAGAHHSSLFDVEGDDHHTAIDLERVIAAGPRAAPRCASALLPASAPLPGLHVVLAALPVAEPDATASPPARPAASRAPPA